MSVSGECPSTTCIDDSELSRDKGAVWGEISTAIRTNACSSCQLQQPHTHHQLGTYISSGQELCHSLQCVVALVTMYPLQPCLARCLVSSGVIGAVISLHIHGSACVGEADIACSASSYRRSGDSGGVSGQASDLLEMTKEISLSCFANASTTQLACSLFTSVLGPLENVIEVTATGELNVTLPVRGPRNLVDNMLRQSDCLPLEDTITAVKILRGDCISSEGAIPPRFSDAAPRAGAFVVGSSSSRERVDGEAVGEVDESADVGRDFEQLLQLAGAVEASVQGTQQQGGKGSGDVSLSFTHHSLAALMLGVGKRSPVAAKLLQDFHESEAYKAQQSSRVSDETTQTASNSSKNKHSEGGKKGDVASDVLTVSDEPHGVASALYILALKTYLGARQGQRVEPGHRGEPDDEEEEEEEKEKANQGANSLSGDVLKSLSGFLLMSLQSYIPIGNLLEDGEKGMGKGKGVRAQAAGRNLWGKGDLIK